MSVHVLLNLLYERRKRDEVPCLSSILFLFRIEFYKFNNAGAQKLDIYLSHGIN